MYIYIYIYICIYICMVSSRREVFIMSLERVVLFFCPSPVGARAF